MTPDSSIPTPSAIPKPKKPLWRRLLKWTVRIAAVLLVLGIAAYAITYYWTAKTINAEIARIRAANEPLTFDDLDKLSPKVDRAQDAGPLYAAACALVNVDYDNPTGNESSYYAFYGPDAPKKPVSAEALAWAHKGIAANHDALDLLDRAAQLPGCNTDIQLQYGISIALTHLGPKRALLNAASLRTRTLALEGKGDAAVDSVISSIGLLRTLDRQPVLIDSLVQVAILSRICSDAAVVLSYGNPSPASLQQLDDALQHAHLVPLRQMFIAERVYSLEIMRNLISNPAEYSSFNMPLLPERQNFTALGITGRYMMAKILPIFRQDIDATSGDFAAILKEAEIQGRKPASTWKHLIGPNFEKPMVIYGRVLASSRAVQIAIQIHNYQSAHNNKLPDSLDQLPSAASLPKDPFTTAQLLYVKTADGYCLMTAGRGHPEDDGNLDRNADPITWSYRWGIHIRTSSANP